MPAILGWLMTVLYNPNNVAFEASPITTILGWASLRTSHSRLTFIAPELDVGTQLCTLLGYDVDASDPAAGWGHIACDGTVANLESIWYVYPHRGLTIR